MDVDLLRPGTVPISPDTVLWFEFLLNPSLLKTHLSKSSSDPSPTDLIIKFVTINSEQREQQNQEVKVNENNEAINDAKPQNQSNWNHKNIALKILSLKVASHLEWNLENFQTKLPLAIQSTLLQDLFFITMDNIIEIPNVPETPPESLSNRALFTLVLYHRWVLNSIVFKALNNKQSRQFFSYNAVAQESNMVTNGMNDDLIKKLEAQSSKSVNFLNQVLQMNDIKPIMLTFDTFQMLTEESTEITQNWNQVHFISDDELKCQINYDLAVYHIYKEEYKNAKICINQSINLYKKLNNGIKLNYCKIDKERLEGYCQACQVSVENKKPNLTQQLLASIKDQYSNIIEILKADNFEKKIPQVYRDNLELDIQGGVANRKIVVARDLLLQIKCLNLVLKVLTNEPLIGDYVFHIKSAGSRGLDMLFWAFNDILPKSSVYDKKLIAKHFLYLVLVGEIEGLADRILNDPNYSCLFSQDELLEIKSEADSQDADIPDLLLKNDWGINQVEFTQKTRIQIHQLEQNLIISYNPQDIKKILTEISCLNNTNYAKPLWQISNTWEIPIPLQSVIAALPDGFLKNYSYILIAKSKELVLLKDFLTSKELLYNVENEVHLHSQKANDSNKHSNSAHNLIFKLQKLLSWEMLLIEICYALHVWPATNICDTKALTERAKQCLTALQSTDQVIPRQEVIEHCAVFLLNMGEWDYLTSLEKQLGCFEFVAALSNAAKFTTNPKFPKETWEMVLAACKPSRDLPQKRSSSNSSGTSGTNISRDTLASISITFNRLRDVTILNIAISLLARLHNILKDESSLELYTLYLNLWPSTINNQKGYNIRIMGEYLFQLLTQALKYYPNNVPWLRLMGDLNFGYYESAMKYYLEAIIVVSDLFTSPIRQPIDDFVYRRMIKCCAQLQCYTQAVVLCQFLDEVDYALAFKMAGNEQKNSAPADAMDAYYHCIWDTTILEYLINLHTKRGEHHRKQLAVKVIGLLELNSNNNEEIQREAANVRKARFLRALAKQYVY